MNMSETCKALCSEDCFSILDIASTSFQLKIKEALHIGWEKPLLNKLVRQSRQSITFILIVLVNFTFFICFWRFQHHCISVIHSCRYLVIIILCALYLYHTDYRSDLHSKLKMDVDHPKHVLQT